ETMAIEGEMYRLAFSSSLIAKVFKRRRDDGTVESLVPDLAETLGGKDGSSGGYVDLDSNGNWCQVPSGRLYYATDPSVSGAQELMEARKHFFRIRRETDPFGNNSILDYDAYDLLLVYTMDAAGNTYKSQNDYRMLKPSQVTDSNGNRAKCVFDEL